MESFKSLRQGLPAMRGQVEKLNREISHNQRFVIGDVYPVTTSGTTTVKVHGDSSTNLNFPANTMISAPSYFSPLDSAPDTATTVKVGANSSGNGAVDQFLSDTSGTVLSANATTMCSGSFYSNSEITPTVTFDGAVSTAATTSVIGHIVFPFSQINEDLTS